MLKGIGVFTSHGLRQVYSPFHFVLASGRHSLYDYLLVASLPANSRQQHDEPSDNKYRNHHPNSNWLVQKLGDAQCSIVHVSPCRFVNSSASLSAHYKNCPLMKEEG